MEEKDKKTETNVEIWKKHQEKWRGVKGKLKYFSEKPGKGS